MKTRLKKTFIITLFIFNLSYSQVYLPRLKKLKWDDIPRREIWAKRITKPIKIDGYLTDEGWKEAAVDSLMWEVCPHELSTPEERTKFFVGYDDENLYFGFICYEKNIKEIRATRVEQRKYYLAILNDDWAHIHIGTDTTVPEVYGFVVTPYGIKHGIYVFLDIDVPEEIDILWYADAKILDSCWTAEIAIPFKSLKFPEADTSCWKLSVSRRRPREVEYSYHWNAKPCGFGYDYWRSLGKLYIPEKIGIREKFEVLPYFTGNLEKKESLKSEFTQKVGLTGKYYFTSTNIFDFTLNPDYSQIESDAYKIDVNTISAIYYEEKRPFFLEGKEIFETPFEIFYTRTINNPLFALKFQGNLKNFRIAYLTGYDRNTPWIIPFSEYSFSIQSNKKSISNIFRVKKNFFSKSYTGILITDRELKESFSRVFTIDGSFIFKNYNYFNYQGIYSWIKEPDDKDLSYEFDGETLYGKGFYLNYKHQSPRYYLNLIWSGLSPDFRADNGFIEINDYEKREGSAGIFFIFNKTPIIERISPGFTLKEVRRFLKGRYYFKKEGQINIGFRNLINTTFVYSTYSYKYKGVDFKNLWDWTIFLSFLTFKNLYLNSYIKYGKSINYYSYPLKSGYVLYPSIDLNLSIFNLRFKAGYSRYMMWEKNYEDRVYNQEIFNGEIAYIFTKFTSIRLINQYNSISREYFIYPLFSFEPTPFTLFYLGSNHTFIRESKKYRQKDFKIFVKIQYQFKF